MSLAISYFHRIVAHRHTILATVHFRRHRHYCRLVFNPPKVRNRLQMIPLGGPEPRLHAGVVFPTPEQLILLALLFALSTTTIALHMISSLPPSANASTM